MRKIIMTDKQKLQNMLDSVIDDNDTQAKVHFHNWLEDKMREVLNPVPVVDDKDSKSKK